jgi:malonyl CoA-acyl carrier protein transacylase
MSLEVLDPTGEREVATRQLVARPASLSGLRVGLLDISSSRSDVFLDRLAQLLTQRGAQVQRFRKSTHARPAPRPLIEQIVGSTDLVVVALAG